MHHINRLLQAFENRQSAHDWCGYAILDQIPNALKSTIFPIKGKRRLGVVLFLNSQEPAQFLFRDFQDNFRIVSAAGQTLHVNKKMEILLDTFHQKNID